MSNYDNGYDGHAAGGFPPDEQLEQRLRQALRAEAQGIVPAGDGLSRIRERTERARPWWRPALAAISAAALFGLAAGAGLALTRDGEGSTSNAAAPPASLQATAEPSVPSATAPLPPSASPSASSTAASTLPPLGSPAATTKPPAAVVPTESPRSTSSAAPESREPTPPRVTSPSPTASPPPSPPAGTLPTAPTGGSVTVPVYYVQKVDGRQRLYREFHRAAQRENAAVTALDEMVGRANDPDYSSLWPSGARAVTYSVKGGVVTVGLSSGGRPSDLAVQQLVHTVTAADRRVDSVSIEVDGTPVTSGPVRRAAAIDVLGFIWIFDLEDGASVARTFTLKGDASVFEAALQWEAVRNGEVAAKGFMTASEGAPGRGTWSTKVDLPAAGTYTIRVFTDSPKDGSAMSVETKTVTAR